MRRFLSPRRISLLLAAPLGALIAAVVLAITPDGGGGPVRPPAHRPAPPEARSRQVESQSRPAQPRWAKPESRPCLLAVGRCDSRSRRCLADLRHCRNESRPAFIERFPRPGAGVVAADPLPGVLRSPGG